MDRNIEELKDRIHESVVDTPPTLIEHVYDNWRIARDQLQRANDLCKKALKKLSGDLNTFFVQLDDNCRCNAQITIGVSDIEDSLDSLTNFITGEVKELEKMRPTKRGSRRHLGKSTIKKLPGGKKEIRTLVEYIDAGGGQVMPKFIIETKDDDDPEFFGETLPKHEDTRPKIQRPSLEENSTCETV